MLGLDVQIERRFSLIWFPRKTLLQTNVLVFRFCFLLPSVKFKLFVLFSSKHPFSKGINFEIKFSSGLLSLHFCS